MVQEQVRLLLGSTPISAAANFIIFIITLVFIRQMLPSFTLLIWSGIFLTVFLLRLATAAAGKKQLSEENAVRWRFLLRLESFLAGSVWGMLPVLLFPMDSQYHVFLIFVGAGITGAAASLTMESRSSILYVGAALAPYTLLLLSEGGEVNYTYGTMILSYFMFLVFSILQGEKTFFTSLNYRMEAELQNNKLRESEDRLRLAQLYTNMGTWEWNIESGSLYWTEGIAPLFGFSNGDTNITYDLFMASIHPEDRSLVTEAVNATLNNNIPYNIEHRVVWPDGTVRWLMESGNVFRSPDGKPLRMLGIVTDINDRKQAEIALLEREQQLREAQHIASLGHWKADMRNGELFWSDEIYKIFGYEPGSFKPSIKFFKDAVHPDDLKKVLQSEKIAEQSGRHDVVHRIIRPDGSIRHVHELAEGEVHASGQLVSLTGTVQDVTEMIDARDEANRANHAKSEFLSSMSHELRTPLNAIMGFSQLIGYDPNLSKENKEIVQVIIQSGHRLLSLVDKVLDLTKIESGHLEIKMESLNIRNLIEECFLYVNSLARHHHITMSCSETSNYTVRADRILLKQALINLLTNAIKYNREGGKVELDVLSSGEGKLYIRVMDTGPGIPSSELEGIFLPFNRLDKKNGEIEGAGIGLTITQRIIELMKGRVNAESREGEGSIFWIELPEEASSHEEKTDSIP